MYSLVIAKTANPNLVKRPFPYVQVEEICCPELAKLPARSLPMERADPSLHLLRLPFHLLRLPPEPGKRDDGYSLLRRFFCFGREF